MTSEALDGQLQSCYAAIELGLNVRRERNVFRLRLNRARELQHKVSVFRELLTKRNKKLSYRRETARQLRIHAQLTRCFSAVAV